MMDDPESQSTPVASSRATDGLLTGANTRNACGLTPQHKKRALFAIGVIGVILVITLSVALIESKTSSSSSSPSPSPSSSSRLFSFDDQFNRSLAPHFASVTWLPKTINITQLHPHIKQQLRQNNTWTQHTHQTAGAAGLRQEDELLSGYTHTSSSSVLLVLLYPNGTQLTSTLYNASTARSVNGQRFEYRDYRVSGDLVYILFNNNYQKVYRHSFLSSYYVYNTVTNTFITIADGQQLQLAQFGPAPTTTTVTSSSPVQLVYVLDSDIWLLSLATNVAVRVTHDGAVGSTTDWAASATAARAPHAYGARIGGMASAGFGSEILNGVCDWAYEEEIFSQSSAIWWAPDATSFLFLKFKQSGVASYLMTQFESPLNTYSTFAYPQPGLNRSVVTVHVYNVASSSSFEVSSVPLSSIDYVTDICYLNNTLIAVRSTSAGQNTSQLIAVDTIQHTTRMLHTQQHQQYLDTMQTIMPIEIPASDTHPRQLLYADLLVHDDWLHIALLDADTGSHVRWLTSGNYWGVDSLLSYRSATQLLYFVSTEPGSTQRALYAVHVITAQRYPVGIIAAEEGNNGTALHYQSASFSADASYFVLNEAADRPQSTLHYNHNTQTDTVNTTQIAVLSDNSVVLSVLSSYSLPTRKFLSVPGSVAGRMLNAMMLYPPDFDPQVKYPVLIQVYGGPGAQQVNAKFCCSSSSGFHTYLASTHKMLIFVVDPIGTGARGDTFQKATTYLNLGVHEAEDVIASISYLATLSYVDANKVAIWGWSYGGFLTSMIATSGCGCLRAVMSVAPVTDWRLYDAIYTERYMRTPFSNPSGYNTSSVLRRVQEQHYPIPGYLLIHGTADDNVHFQHSAILMSLLELSDVSFSLMVYPNRDHSLAGPAGQDNKHLYRALTQHIIQHLQLNTTNI